jgi:hypothetical protein
MTAKEAPCRRDSEHSWSRVYQGATLDAYTCTRCGAERTTPGTALGPRKSRAALGEGR